MSKFKINKKAIKYSFIVFLTLITLICVSSIVLTLMGYGFTSKNALSNAELKAFADNECTSTEDYDFYYSTMSNYLFVVVPVKKHGFLYKVDELNINDYKKVVDDENKTLAHIYTYKGKNCYYNWIKPVLHEGNPLYGFENIIVNDEPIDVIKNCYFITNMELTSFAMGELSYKIIDAE